MINPKVYERHLQFVRGVQDWLIENLEQYSAFFVNPEERIQYDWQEDRYNGLFCGEFKRPYFSIIDRTTGQEVATVELIGYSGMIRVKSKSAQFDSKAGIFTERFGRSCLFINHDLETLIGLPATEEPELYVDSEEAFRAIASMSVSLPDTVTLNMKHPGYTASVRKYQNRGFILHLSRDPTGNPGQTLEIRLPVEITKPTPCYLR